MSRAIVVLVNVTKRTELLRASNNILMQGSFAGEPRFYFEKHMLSI